MRIRKKIIYGCDSRGDAQSPYLTRWTLLDLPFLSVCLHRFHRSDADEMHDHPWPFWSVILWRGYIEETPVLMYNYPHGERKRRRVWPGMILRRQACWIHRVDLVDGKEAWTLVFRGRVVREWGFWTKHGWQRWREYFRERGC